jgi:hypothetical protein
VIEEFERAHRDEGKASHPLEITDLSTLIHLDESVSSDQNTNNLIMDHSTYSEL